MNEMVFFIKTRKTEDRTIGLRRNGEFRRYNSIIYNERSEE